MKKCKNWKDCKAYDVHEPSCNQDYHEGCCGMDGMIDMLEKIKEEIR